MSTESTWSPRVQVHRTPSRGSYDRRVVNAVLDEGFFAHVGFMRDERPCVIPMVYGRRDDTLYLHGSVASRQMRTMEEAAPVCVTVTHVRDLVLARSALNLSVNYHCVVVLGTARPVTEIGEKMEGLETIVEHVIPGRWQDLRLPSRKESASVTVIAVPITEASVKVRLEPPFEEEGDERLPAWGGLIPLTTEYGPPVDDAHVTASTPAPGYVTGYARPLAPPPPAAAYGRRDDETPGAES